MADIQKIYYSSKALVILPNCLHDCMGKNASDKNKQYWVDSDTQKKLLEQVAGELMLAAMVCSKTEEGCLRWLETKVPALQNIKPSQCLFDPKLLIRLRETLMRME